MEQVKVCLPAHGGDPLPHWSTGGLSAAACWDCPTLSQAWNHSC